MRQETGRSKSPAARILSLALALCMIAAFVPAITLTARAGSTTGVIDSYDATVLWATPNGMYSNADVSWDGWTATETSEYHAIYLNTSANAGNVLKFQRTTMVWSQKDRAATVTSPGYGANADSLIIEWTADYSTSGGSNGSDTYYDFTFYDTLNKEIAAFSIDYVNGAYSESTYKIGKPAVGADCAIVVTNNSEDGTHKVEYWVDGSVLTTESDLDGTISGFGYMTATGGGWTRDGNYIGFGDLTIAGIYSNTCAETLQAALDYSLGLPMGTRESLTLVSGVTDAAGGEYDVTWSSSDPDVIGDNGTYYDPEAVTDVELTASADYMDGDGNTTTLTSTHTVKVFPESRANTYWTIDSGENVGVYKIGSSNYIDNGSFEDGNGSFTASYWYNSQTADTEIWNDTSKDYFWMVSEDSALSAISESGSTAAIYSPAPIPLGNYALGTRWPDALTALCTIHNFWEVKNGQSYYFSFYAKSGSTASTGRVIEAYLTTDTTCGNETKSVSTQVYAPTTTKDWEKYECVLTVPDDGVQYYLSFLAYNLGGSSSYVNNFFDDFEMYDAELQEDTSFSVTRNYYFNEATEDNLYQTVTKTALKGNTLTFDAIYYTENGSNEFYYEPEATYDDGVEDAIDIVMTPVENWGNYSVGETVQVSGKEYAITGSNIVPNGDFEYEMNGWYSRANTTPPTKYSITTENKPDAAERAAVATDGGSSSSENSIKRGWAVESGDYYYSIWVYYNGINSDYTGLAVTSSPTTEASSNNYIFFYDKGEHVTNRLSAGWTQLTGTFTATEDSYVVFHEGWDVTGVANVEIYPVEENTEASAEVILQYTVGDTPIKTLDAQSVIKGASLDYDELYYYVDGGNELYYIKAGTIDSITESGTIELPLTAVENGGNYATGDTVIIDGSVYEITSENLIPNGDFEYGLEGWLACDGNAASTSNFTVNGDGTVTPGDSKGATSPYSIYRAFGIEEGTYFYSYDVASTGNTSSGDYRITTFANTLGYSSNNELKPLLIGNDRSAGSAVLADYSTAGTNQFIIDNTTGNSYATVYPYLRVRYSWTNQYYGNFELYKVEYVGEATTKTVNYTYEGVTIGTDSVETAENSHTFPERTFYHDGAIYTAPAQVVAADRTETVEVEKSDNIAPTYDGFFTADSATEIAMYIKEDNTNMIRLSGSTGEDNFNVMDLVEAYAGSGANADKTRVGYLEFEAPTGYVAGNPISITLTVADGDGYGITSDAVGSYVVAFAATVDVSSLSDNVYSAIDLGINGDSYPSKYALTADTTEVTIDLTGIAAVDGAIKVALVVPRGNVWFANEERTDLCEEYEGKTAYAVIDASPAVTATVNLVDSKGNKVGTYSIDVSNDTTSITVPAGVYFGDEGGQYYLDADATPVAIAIGEGETAVTAEDTVTVGKLSIFTWDYTTGSIASTNGTYNAAAVVTWNDERVGYAYTTVPEYNEDIYNLVFTVTATYNNGFDGGGVPGLIVETVDAAALAAIDLASEDAGTALAALEGTQIAKVAMYDSSINENIDDVYDTKYTNNTAGRSYIVTITLDEIPASGEIALRLSPNYSDAGIAVISNVSFDTEQKPIGVELVDGAQIRVGAGVGTDDKIATDSDSGIRFIAKINAENTIAATKFDETSDAEVKVGIAIYDGGTAETAEYPDKNTDVSKLTKIEATNYQDTEGKLFTVAITNIKTENYNHIYVAVPYVEYNDETFYDFDNAVARTPYQVAAGILRSGSISESGYTYSVEDETKLYAVLNAYANMTGARIEFTSKSDFTQGVGVAKYANGANEFFTISSYGYNDDNTAYVITLTPYNTETTKFYDYAKDTYRVNNSHTSFEETLGASAVVDADGNLVITIPVTTTSDDDGSETESE